MDNSSILAKRELSMRTPREFYHMKPIVYSCELDSCPTCGMPMKVAYVSGPKAVHTMTGQVSIAHRPKRCAAPSCTRQGIICKSAGWQQLAPCHGTYGYDVVAHIGWQRQTGCQSFQAIRDDLHHRMPISESQVRHLYHECYLPLLACHERQHRAKLTAVAKEGGLILSLDGLMPEGGEPQLWVVRELHTGLTLRTGWLGQEAEDTFAEFLQPIADLGLPVTAVLTDKQRGLVPAVTAVFPRAKHGFCQIHYLRNASRPMAEADQAMKIRLRQQVRDEIGPLIRQEQVETAEVLTVTGLVPSPVVGQPAHNQAAPDPHKAVWQQRDAIVQDLKRRIRYLLTLKARPPFCLAGLEMVERLAEVEDCLAAMIAHYDDPTLLTLHAGLHGARRLVQTEYADLRRAAGWMRRIADILDPDGKPSRSGQEVSRTLWQYLENIQAESQLSPQLQRFYQTIVRTTNHYTAGLFTCYDVPGLPRTNNDRESEFRDLTRRLLRTTGQKGLVQRMLQRQGAWELIPRPDSLSGTVTALRQVTLGEFRQERQRVRDHRGRFRLHVRSARQSGRQLEILSQRWTALPREGGP